MGARLSCWRAVLHDGGMTRPITIAAIVAIAAVALTVAEGQIGDGVALGRHLHLGRRDAAGGAGTATATPHANTRDGDG